VAAGQLQALSDEQLDKAAARLAELPAASQRTLIEVLASRRGQEALPLVLSIAKSDRPELRLAGIRCLGLVGDRSVIPLLVDSLSSGGESTEAAQQALVSLPRGDVGRALLDALQTRPEIRPAVIDVLKTLRYYEAIDPLIAIAAQGDKTVYGPALDGLRGIADPDKHDIPRLVKLLLNTEPGEHRDEVEKTILIVCEKLPAGADRTEPVLGALAQVDPSQSPKCLPLLGRLGGPKALAKIEPALGDSNLQIQEAAVRALCNWPNAEVADRLLAVATDSEVENFRRWALRAYVRVISLKSDRPDAQTLAMLQNAMKLAKNADDRQLVLERTSTVRTMEAVVWLAEYLDDQSANQAACRAIVELAHHRFLRHPNMDHFGPILDRISKISKDPEVVQRAKRYRLGL
jgi:HEAT repeat protein